MHVLITSTLHIIYLKLPCKDIHKPAEVCIVPHNANFIFDKGNIDELALRKI